jgi:hypothetical protein
VDIRRIRRSCSSVGAERLSRVSRTERHACRGEPGGRPISTWTASGWGLQGVWVQPDCMKFFPQVRRVPD